MKVLFMYDCLEYPRVFKRPNIHKWEHWTWRERIKTGKETWETYRQYRFEMMETDSMERAGLDDRMSTLEIEMHLPVKSDGDIQAFISIKTNG